MQKPEQEYEEGKNEFWPPKNTVLMMMAVPVQVTFSHDAILVSSTLHQIPLAMLVSLFRITLVVCFLFCCLSMARDLLKSLKHVAMSNLSPVDCQWHPEEMNGYLSPVQTAGFSVLFLSLVFFTSPKELPSACNNTSQASLFLYSAGLWFLPISTFCSFIASMECTYKLLITTCPANFNLEFQ
ncbi:hypothetical protein QQP08_021964 [Theobroma cacao]|nr:hypothetical protein QQP08_021964 [Theobroma cacao]